MPKIAVKMIDEALDPLAYTGDRVDVRISAVTVPGADATYVELARGDMQTDQVFSVKAGQSIKIAHGFALELPKGHEAILLPRSSAFAKTGLLFASSGVIDEGYNGDTDEWFSVWWATRDCDIMWNQRIAQFRVQAKQEPIEFKAVDSLGNVARGGHGSTGDF